MIHVGVIGYGYWGPNVVRNLYNLDGCRVAGVCDRSASALTRVRRAYPDLAVTENPLDLLTSPKVDAIAVVTPVHTHFELAKAALEHGKHVFVEKPFTASSAQAEELIEMAERRKLKIMVDHTFLFTGAVKKIRELVDERVLGDLYYYDSTRVNLGLFQHDVSVIWDLAPHDLSIMDFLIRQKAQGVVATGEAHFNGQADVAFITVYFPGKTIAHINVNWLSPVKVRTTLIGGEKRMLVWNDLEAVCTTRGFRSTAATATRTATATARRKGSTSFSSAIARATCGRRDSSGPRLSPSSWDISSTASREIRHRSTMGWPGRAW